MFVGSRKIRVGKSTWAAHTHTHNPTAPHTTKSIHGNKREQLSECTWSCYSSIWWLLFLFPFFCRLLLVACGVSLRRWASQLPAIDVYVCGAQLCGRWMDVWLAKIYMDLVSFIHFKVTEHCVATHKEIAFSMCCLNELSVCVRTILRSKWMRVLVYCAITLRGCGSPPFIELKTSSRFDLLSLLLLPFVSYYFFVRRMGWHLLAERTSISDTSYLSCFKQMVSGRK